MELPLFLCAVASLLKFGQLTSIQPALINTCTAVPQLFVGRESYLPRDLEYVVCAITSRWPN